MGRSHVKRGTRGAQGYCTLEFMVVTMVTSTGSSQQNQSASWQAALIAFSGYAAGQAHVGKACGRERVCGFLEEVAGDLQGVERRCVDSQEEWMAELWGI